MLKLLNKINQSIAKDKLLHFFVGSVLFNVSLTIFSLPISIILLIVIGVGKEVYDIRMDRKEEYLDIVFTLLPVLLYLITLL